LAKKKIEKPRREVTKRQLSRWQQQKKRQRIIFGVGIVIISVVLVVVGVGWYINEYRPLHQTVIRVNDTEFDMNYYIERLKFYGAGQGIFYLYSVVYDVETIIEQSELIRQAAMKLGISVSDSEVDEELKRRDLPLSEEYRDAIRDEVLVKKLGDEYFEHQVPVFAEQRHIMAMFLESESQALEVRARLEAGEDFAELAGELSLESFTQSKNGDLGWRPEDVLTILLDTSIPSEYAFGSEVGVLSQPLHDEAKIRSGGYWLIKVSEWKEELEEAHVHVMLLGSEEEAQQVKSSLEAGEDFTALAKELSRHEDAEENGGDLGWVSPCLMIPAFDEFVFDPEVEPGEVSEPIKEEGVAIQGGYWLVKVLDEDDNREIEEDDRSLLKVKALSDWISALWDDPEYEVTSYLDDEMKRWAADRAYKELESSRGLRQ